MDLEELAERVVELERKVDALKAREERLVAAMRSAEEHAYNVGYGGGDVDADDAISALSWALCDMLRALEAE